jgi:hypothetical protein
VDGIFSTITYIFCRKYANNDFFYTFARLSAGFTKKSGIGAVNEIGDNHTAWYKDLVPVYFV